MTLSIAQHRQLHLGIRFGLFLGLGGLLVYFDPPDPWGWIGFIGYAATVLIAPYYLARLAAARCDRPGCGGESRLTTVEGHHSYRCERCDAVVDGGTMQFGSDQD
ncbi:hypothetical protein [Chitinimonas koreensis]|uniref:hypothetical protein n=1 Tax=Chitinimonas koreensis TaxID=356302 RepID=UPI0003F554B1|nr:hypothetical protein [Chitinimonas koreensis]QNM96793.1 hypothetical protein H9L41_00045 [Chitinimonas koreensis]